MAGITIESFDDITFENTEVDLFNTPLWVDAAMEVIIDQKTRNIILGIERKNVERLREELSEARRMKNALKEVFIPETMAHIRKN
ncbi:MAG: hypothetical protein IPJ40_18945 [Saprospirales bacterium]|nr:hypothetical protein [Saprospirales bacterium]